MAFFGFSTMFMTPQKVKKRWLECREGKQPLQTLLEEKALGTATPQSNMLVP